LLYNKNKKMDKEDKDNTIVTLDKRVSLLEEKLPLYLEQINNSLFRLEKTISEQVEKSTGVLKEFISLINIGIERDRLDNKEMNVVLKRRLRKLEDEQLKFTSWRLLVVWLVPTVLAIFSLISKY